MRDVSDSAAIETWLSGSTRGGISRRLAAAAQRAESLGQAFAVGIQASIAHLTEARYAGTLCSVAVSEDGGNHPRHLTTTWDESRNVVTGCKSFVTLGATAALMLVAARDSRELISICVVPTSQLGVVVTPLPDLKFAPDLNHARVTFNEARLETVLECDGYTGFTKPFRVYEDLYTRLAACEYALTLEVSRTGEYHAMFTESCAKLRSVISQYDGSPALILKVEESIASVDADLRMVGTAADDPETRALWERDLPVFEVGASARRARLAKAISAS